MYCSTKNALFALSALAAPAAAVAETPRDLLTEIAFGRADRATTLTAIDRTLSPTTLARAGDVREIDLIRAMATGYRAKLTRSRTDAVNARNGFSALVGRNPKDAEAQAALGSWHLDAVSALGGFTAGLVLGASRAKGYAALDAARRAGGNRALFVGLEALLRAKLDGPSADTIRLATQATAAAVPTALDRIVARNCATLLPTLRSGDAVATRRAAARLLPLGRFDAS